MKVSKDFKEFYESIKKLNYPKEKLEIIIIFNNSHALPKQTQNKFPEVIFISPKKNLGFAKAVNLGITKSNGKYIFVGNEDLIVTPNSIKKMVSKMENRKNIGILGGKIYFKDKPIIIASHGHDFNFLLGLVKDDPRSPDIEKNPLWVDGGAMMISKKVLDKIGLFDEKFFPIYFEDADLCLRAKKAGWNVVYDPTIIFYHGQSQSFDAFPSWKKYLIWYKSKLRFMVKHAIQVIPNS